VLGKALRHRAITLALAAGSMVGSCTLVSQVKSEFVPPEDRATFSVDVELPVGTSLKTTRQYVEAIATDLRTHAPGAQSTFVTIGGGAQGQVNIGKIQLNLSPAKGRGFHQRDAMAWVRERYQGLKGANVTVNEVNPVGGESGFRSQPIQYNIRGENMDELVKAADALMTELRALPGFVDIDMSYRGGKPEIAVDVNRKRAADQGVPVAAIATTLRALVAGDKVTDFKDGLDLYDVTMRLTDAQKAGLTSLQAWRACPSARPPSSSRTPRRRSSPRRSPPITPAWPRSCRSRSATWRSR
jgi:HAE1 family hydrophobic/amphiphilic exporter-1